MTLGQSAAPLASPPRRRVRILLATFNGETHLEAQIRSLSSQRGVQIDLLTSDDGSQDRTVERTRALAAACNLPHRPLPGRAGTGSAARNFFRLLEEADFADVDYVALCDQDDVWCEGKLERACSELERTGSDAYSCNSIAFWPDGRRRSIRKDFPKRSLDYLFESASHGCTYVMTAGTAERFQVFLRECRTDVGAITFHDWLIYAWARHHHLRWHLDDRAEILYRQSEHNFIGANAGFSAIWKRLSDMRRGWLGEQAIAIADAIGESRHPVVHRLRRMNWRDRLMLAVSARSFRRRPRDQCVLALVCLLFGL